MQKQILSLLKTDTEAYEAMVFDTYHQWCMDFCISYDRELQHVLANSALNKYFLTEYSKFEAQFISMAQDYENKPNITPADMREMYHNCTYGIFNRRSMPLIEQAKKTQLHHSKIN